jgi:membrane protease YdiL (CAAX protease family)
LANVIRRHPVAAYFALTFSISWMGALALAAPYMLRDVAVPQMAGLMTFPIMLIGPCCAGIGLTWFLDGRAGLRDLSRRARRASVGRWYAVLLIPPALVLTVLLILKTLVSPLFSPNNFVIGVSFGVIAGFFEEIGWMGYAYPRMRAALSPLRAALLLGILWSAWHIPAIDYLGTATPHGSYWLPFFLAFAAAMAAMRVLIAWVYLNTESVLLAQLLHASSTGSLVVFSPAHVAASQEALWYAIYACALWAVVVAISGRFSTIQGSCKLKE